ncbi:MAG TPA: hypothetical protein VFO14_23150 [Vicinamibacterales bacterium]|nr:hypothetical protein [Vicinamibacterales bacterium]
MEGPATTGNGGDRKADRHCRIQVTAGDMPDGVGHRQQRQAEREGNAEQADSDVGKCGRQHGTAAPAKHQPEGADELRCQRLCHHVVHSSKHGMRPLCKVLSSCKKSADQGSFWSSIVGAIIGFW